jgi:hypothetical protein
VPQLTNKEFGALLDVDEERARALHELDVAIPEACVLPCWMRGVKFERLLAVHNSAKYTKKALDYDNTGIVG